ncbi:hypothetical protein MKW94_023014 [Papaver nudicaule]|uniref:Nicotianamine synthase n=1 Tax=Papaver nudicaule TaxID=74823 RepID=A0AA42ASB1_PAPNU|nr:hypothetical protein [Papaver nudicaule]
MGSLGSLVSCDQEEMLVQNVCEIYDNLSTLKSLKPSKHVDTLFTRLVLTCMPPSPIDVTKLSGKVQGIRSKLIRLCGEAEGLLESHFSALLGSYATPLVGCIGIRGWIVSHCLLHAKRYTKYAGNELYAWNVVDQRF